MRKIFLIVSVLVGVGLAVDVKETKTTSVKTYTTFNQRVGDIAGAAYEAFYNNSILPVSGHLQIPATLKGQMLGSSKFTSYNNSSTDTLEFLGSGWKFSDGCFGDSLTVLLPSGCEVRPEWWGTGATAIKRAIATAQYSKNNTVIMSTKYQVTATILINGTYPITLKGSGDSTGFYTVDSTIIVLKCTTPNSTFSNFKIIMPDSAAARGTGTDADYGYPVGLYVRKADKCNIENIKIYGGHSDGIIVDSSNYCKIKNCDVNGAAYQSIMAFNAENAEITDNVCYGYSGYGSSGIRTERGHNGIIKNNIVYGLAGYGIRIEDSKNCLINGNICHDNSSSGIFIYGPESGYTYPTINNNISNNICYDNSCPNNYGGYITQGGGGIELRGAVQNNIFTGNVCYTTKTPYIIDDFENSTGWVAGTNVTFSLQYGISADTGSNACRIVHGDTSMLINCATFPGTGTIAYKNFPSGLNIGEYNYLSMAIWTTFYDTTYDCIRLWSGVDKSGSVIDSIQIKVESQKSSFMMAYKMNHANLLTNVKCVEFYRHTSSTQNLILDYMVAGVSQWWGIVSALLYSDTKYPLNNTFTNNHLDSNNIVPFREFQSVPFGSSNKIYGQQFFKSDSTMTIDGPVNALNTISVDSLYAGNGVFNTDLGVGNQSPISYKFQTGPVFAIGKTSDSYSTASIVSKNSGIGYLSFADTMAGAGRYSGLLSYDHSTDMMTFRTKSGISVTIDSTGRVSIPDTTSSTFSTTGALVVPNGGIGAMHVTTDSLRVGSSGSRFKEIKVIDGAADTLSITVGTKTWKLLPVANQ